MVSILRLSLLGSPAIEYDGKPVRLEMRKTFALLAYLSLSSQSSSRESLAAMFWPEFDQQHALTNLRRNVFSLGRALPPGLLEADRERIDLKKENWFELDVDQFLAQLSSVTEHSHPPGEICQDCVSSLEKAVNLYRGDFLEGFNLKDCPDFDEWQFFQRESLRSEYAGALKKLAEHYQEVRDWDKAIRVVRSWVALDRLNEQAHRVLITLYNQSGQRSKAFRQYESLVDLLQNDLGQDPEEETLLLYQNLLLNKNEEGIKDSQPLSKPTSRLSEPLIKTKLFIPPLRIDRVPRPQLVELLDAGAQRPLTLVSAPAGFGKTTLLTSWAAHTNLPVAWFSIDEGDNDPVRFMSYLITAVDSALMTNISGEFDGFTQSMQHSAQPALIQLINRLAAENEHFVLILDDYQFISSQEIHETLAYLLEKIPACMHLVIATRSDPPISLALLRARDQLTEIRMDVLRFNIEESGDFINKVMSLNISNEDITLLEGRTEGWIAGLQMAALAIRTATSHLDKEETSIIDGQAVSQFIKAFSGSNKYILDYLVEQVLNNCSGDIRKFLLKTSILERFSGPLCDAVMQTQGSQAVLEELEKENLFVVPLDSERHWYRYHHLFAELLFFKLEETISKNSTLLGEGFLCLEDLHQRAADWFENAHQFSDAISHYIKGKLYERAADLIEKQATQMMFNKGQIYTVREWLDMLPAGLFNTRPHLNIAKAWISIPQDQFAQARKHLEIAQQVLNEIQDAEVDGILGEMALVRGVMGELYTRDVDIMRTQGLIAWKKLPPDDSMLRGLAAWLVGASHLFDGDISQAEYYLVESIRLCKEAGNSFITSVAILDLSNVLVERGRYRQAYHLLMQTINEMSFEGRHLRPNMGYLYYGISQILLAWNEIAEAERQLEIGIDLVAQDIPGEILLMDQSLLPHIKLAQGKRTEAIELAERCLQQVEGYPLPYVQMLVKANLVHIWLRVGDHARVEEWLSSCGMTPNDTIRCVHEDEYIALAQVLLWQGQTQESIKILDQIYGSAKRQRREGKLYYILALKAMGLKQLDDNDRALDTLGTSLRMSQPERYIRPYIDMGEPMEELLQLGLSQGLWHQAPLDGYVKRLLSAIQEDQAQIKHM